MTSIALTSQQASAYAAGRLGLVVVPMKTQPVQQLIEAPDDAKVVCVNRKKKD